MQKNKGKSEADTPKAVGPGKSGQIDPSEPAKQIKEKEKRTNRSIQDFSHKASWPT